MGNSKRLTDLNPQFLNAHMGARGSCVVLDCPCGCGDRFPIPFKVALDGTVVRPDGWDREGDTFETLTLRPSIYRKWDCGWHGFITNGEVTSV